MGEGKGGGMVRAEPTFELRSRARALTNPLRSALARLDVNGTLISLVRSSLGVDYAPVITFVYPAPAFVNNHYCFEDKRRSCIQGVYTGSLARRLRTLFR